MTVYHDNEPEPIVQRLIELLPPNAQVLDIGCGEGRNALALARHGFRLETWDKDPGEIAELKQRIGSEKLPINAIACDMRDLRIGYDRWSAVLTILCMHFLPPQAAKERLRHVRAALLPGGYHALVGFTDQGSLPKVRNDRYFPAAAEYIEPYKGWEILVQETEMATCVNPGPNGEILNAERLTLLARKPI